MNKEKHHNIGKKVESMLKTVKQIASHFKIAEVKVYKLINELKLVTTVEVRPYSGPEVTIDMDEIQNYFNEHPETLTEWQNKLEETQRGAKHQPR